MKRGKALSIRHPWIALIVAVATFAGSAAWTQAQNTTENFVTRSYRGSDVLRVNAELSLPPTASHGTTIVTIQNPKRKSPQDRDFEVVFYMASWGNGQEAFGYSIPAQLLQGQSQVTVEIPHPLPSPQFYWKVVVYENGRSIEDKRQTNAIGSTFNYGYIDGADQLTIAALRGQDETSASVNRLLRRALRLDQSNTLPVVPGSFANANAINREVRIVPVSEAGEDWRFFLPFSSWVLSVDTLRELSQSHVPVADALRHYVASGGSVLIHGVENQTRMAEVEQWMGFADARDGYRGWQAVKTYRPSWWWLDVDEEGLSGTSEAADDSNDADDDQELSSKGAIHDAAVLAETWLQSRLVGHVDSVLGLADVLGTDELEDSRYLLQDLRDQLIETLATEEILRNDFLAGEVFISAKPLSKANDQLVSNVFQGSQVNSAATLSAAERDSNWFWRNLIQAVGRPPVWIFCGLVTLFGAVLGPGLLFFTARQKRRSLMIFLVPLVSLLATVSIIAYGVLHEGFTTYARTTSVAHFDFDAQTGFAWSRQSYFSGQPPRQGLMLRGDTYARVVVAEQESYYRPLDPVRAAEYRVALSPDGQNWRGWLKARTQQQLLIGHPLEKLQSPFELTKVEAKLKVKNLSGQDLPLAVFRGVGDDYYFVADLKAGDVVELEPATQVDVSSDVAAAMVALKPEQPPELDDGGTLNIGFGNRRRARTTGFESDDVINVVFKRYLSDKLDMKPFSFATILSENPAIEMPIQGESGSGGGAAVVTEGLHIVIGNQKW